MENLTFIEAPVVTEWKRQSEDKGILKGKIATLLRILRRRGAIPDELSNRINACSDNAQLDSWTDAALDTATLDDFRVRVKL